MLSPWAAAPAHRCATSPARWMKRPLSRVGTAPPPCGNGRCRSASEKMVGVYCRERHGWKDSPCAGCAELLVYARERLVRCPYGEDKPPCTKCPIHCYKPKMRDKVREVMRYSGPRMLKKRPVPAIRHLVDEKLGCVPTKHRKDG